MEPLHTETITERSLQLRKVSSESRRKFRKGMLGTTQSVLVEGRVVNGRNVGFTDNYIPVFAPADSVEGSLKDIVLTEQNIVWGQR
jgi:tRNA A37 methylthiotransferase MiaB